MVRLESHPIQEKMLVEDVRSEVPAELIKLVKCEEVSVHKAA